MDVDARIQSKRLELKEAFAAHRSAREAAAQMRKHLLDLSASGQVQDLDSEESRSSARFTMLSEDLAKLHQEKYGSWHITWRGNPRP